MEHYEPCLRQNQHGDQMKKTFTYSLLFMIVVVAACTPEVVATSESTSLPVMTEVTQPTVTDLPAVTETPVTSKSYSNVAYGLSFQFPATWFGPEEYISDPILRVEVGSDKVYPYGTSPEERKYDLKNSYSVVIQYSKNDQNQYWKDTYQSLLAMQDGEELSDGRGLMIRVGQVKLERFEGIEYIATLSESAQTEPVYIRQVILFDDQSNLLTVVGTPNNVEISSGTNWRDVYRSIDEENVDIFHAILGSIIIE
jgi:hypothetical protein